MSMYHVTGHVTILGALQRAQMIYNVLSESLQLQRLEFSVPCSYE